MSKLSTFRYKDPSTGKIESFNYRLPDVVKTQSPPIGGWPIKRMAKKAKKKK